MLSPERELVGLRLLDQLSSHLKRLQDPQHAGRYVIRETRGFLNAEAACVAIAADQPGARVLFTVPRTSVWDLDLLARFVRIERPTRPDDLLLAPVRRHGAPWAALGFSRSGRPFDRYEKHLVSRIADLTSDTIQRIDRDRMLEIRARIDRKIREQLHPKDLFYQILDGLRSLTRYDHSSALLIRDDGGDTMELAAEQIAWAKAKSARIGRRLTMTDEIRAMLDSGRIYGFDRSGEGWHEWERRPLGALAEWLDFGSDGEQPTHWQEERSILCAPLVGRDGLIGVLKVAGRLAGTLTRYDADLVEGFRGQAAQAIDILNRAESLQARMLTAERRHAIAELARSVSHDVNNALGSMLPLIQQMLADLRTGTFDPVVSQTDLEQVHHSVQVCRRIFGGMLSFARGGVRRTRGGHVRTALETTLAILKNGIDRRGIHLSIEMPADEELPSLACGESDLEQVLLNLLANAREASRPGDRLMVKVIPTPEGVTIVITDTGHGISPENLPRVLEPFFTTKPEGNGLGLTICRSIVWEAGGTIDIDSAAGVGTRITVTIPRASQTQPASAL